MTVQTEVLPGLGIRTRHVARRRRRGIGPSQAPARRRDEAFDPLALTREIVREADGVFTLDVRGNAMADALVAEGDVVLLQPCAQPDDGELVAVRIKGRHEPALRRIYRAGNQLRLQPENRRMAPDVADAEDVEVQGRVIAIVRQRG